jgi:multidrug efflux system outer membrane protein
MPPTPGPSPVPRAADVAWRSFFEIQAAGLICGGSRETIAIFGLPCCGSTRRAACIASSGPGGLPTWTRRGASRSRSEGFDETADYRESGFDVGASVASFELDFWGRVRSLTESARANYLSTVYGQRAFQIGLVADVAEAYLTERELDARIGIAERTVESRRRALEIGRMRFDAGVTSALDYRQIETLLTQAQSEVASLQLQRAQIRNLLVFLVGGSLPEALPAARPLALQGLVENISPGLPSELLTNRPDILEAEERLRAANADVGAARAAFFPQISLTGALGFASSALASLFSGDALTASFGGNAALPIFDGGRTRANVDVAVARRGIATADYERTIQNAFREVSDRLAGRRWLADRLTAQQREAAAQRERAELATLRYRNGVANFLEVLDAERELFAAEQQVLLTRREQLTNSVELYVALGGGLEGGATTVGYREAAREAAVN